ncbi:MAG TPA: response regulator [Kofleriaceae bacterium]|jgi:CheY-like chemotaxis protein
MIEILIVDDDEVWLRTLRRALQRPADWQLTYVSNSTEALALLAAKHFDVVVSDFHMPGPDGIAVLHAAGSAIRILATASELDCDLGAIDLLLAKPFQAADLRQTIDLMIGARAPACESVIGRCRRP